MAQRKFQTNWKNIKNNDKEKEDQVKKKHPPQENGRCGYSRILYLRNPAYLLFFDKERCF
jgi:hypothetical protein